MRNMNREAVKGRHTVHTAYRKGVNIHPSEWKDGYTRIGTHQNIPAVRERERERERERGRKRVREITQ